MIEGHGDDIWRYAEIRMNFSTNIWEHQDHTLLERYLRDHMAAIYSYPEPTSLTLERLIAQEYHINDNEVMVTSGATDAIYLLAQAFRHYKTYNVARPTFCEYDDACRMFGWKESAVPAVYWICNPNNPTGHVYTNQQLCKIACKHELLIVDQSYEDYTLSEIMSPGEALRHLNIIQLHSMTKRLGIPGLRLGYIIASATLIETLRSQYRPWAVNAMAIEAGKWFFRHHEQIDKGMADYLTEAQRLRDRLNEIEGIEVEPTQTNYMLGKVTCATAAALKEYLASVGILIRDASNFRNLTKHHFRVAAQSPCENDVLVGEIHRFVTIHQ